MLDDVERSLISIKHRLQHHGNSSLFILASCVAAWMLRYGMANEEIFQSLSVESASDLSANRKRMGKAAIENARTGTH